MSQTAAPAIHTVDPDEIERFARIADEWWNPEGNFAPLHRFNPVRVAYLRDRMAGHFHRDPDRPRPLAGLRVLDIGCGGGLIAEPLARLGAEVTAIDAGERNIAVARQHAEQAGLAIDYRCTTAEALAAASAQFDVVLTLEVVEHVADRAGFMALAAGMVRPGGLLIAATLNRTVKALALAVIGAEYLLRWLPRGTHDWRKFVRPSELAAELRAAGLVVSDIAGITYHPATGSWSRGHDVGVNYLMTALRPDQA